MKSIMIKLSILAVLLLAVISFNSVNAASSQKMFGGVITQTKATEIQQKEEANYKCIVPGKTITIRPKSGNDTSYFIPAFVKQKNGKNVKANQDILGYYSNSKTTISCVYQGYPPKTSTVTLTPITLFGTND